MNKLPLLICFFLSVISFQQSNGQNKDTSAFKVFLIGDAGENDTTGETLTQLRLQLEKSPNSVVVFLGDNCYLKPFFLLPVEIGGFNGNKKSVKRMMSQLNILQNYKGSAYFIPGNHDWWNKTNIKGGKKKLLCEQKFIENTLSNFRNLSNRNLDYFFPKNGMIGPVSKQFVNDQLRIIFIDTYRLIIEEGKIKKKDSLITAKFYTDLRNQLLEAAKSNQKLIVVAHHPLVSKGKHSMEPSFIEKLFFRFGTSNLNFAAYQKAVTKIDSLLKESKKPSMYYASGHEHSLEYFFQDNIRYIISGAGSKTDNITIGDSQNKNECVIWNQEGFFEIEFHRQKDKVFLFHKNKLEKEMKVECVSGCE